MRKMTCDECGKDIEEKDFGSSHFATERYHTKTGQKVTMHYRAFTLSNGDIEFCSKCYAKLLLEASA